MDKTSDDIRQKYTTDYYQRVCGGDEAPAFDVRCPLPLRIAQPFSMAGLRPHDRVLDLGCGRGEVVCEAARLGCDATGVDYSADAIQIARQQAAGAPWAERCAFLHASITEAAVLDGQFDVVFALDVFEHLHRDELRRLLAIVKERLRPGGRFVFHTSPNRHYYTVAYRTVWALSLMGTARLPRNGRASSESELHIGELTRRELETLLAEAGFESELSLFGIERILHTIHVSGLGASVRRRLARWACRPGLRTYTNSDVGGLASHHLSALNRLYTLQPGQEIPLDHPFFFHEGWYVPVGGEHPHRWASPHGSVKAIATEDMNIRFVFTRWPDRITPTMAFFGNTRVETRVVERDATCELTLRWPRSDSPQVMRFTSAPFVFDDYDPRLFGACIEQVVCEGPETEKRS